MQIIRSLEYRSDTKEENLPQYEEDFPYICTQARLSEYQQKFVPWHWHAAVELFYMEKGEVEYTTPGGKTVFEEGTVGLVNSNVLHMTRPVDVKKENVQILHIFDVSLLAGPSSSRITKKYITPLLTCPGLEIMKIVPDSEEKQQLIRQVKESFQLKESDRGYELYLRDALSEIWIGLLEQVDFSAQHESGKNRSREGLKAMMVFVHEHYAEKVTVEDIAEAGFLSVRECYRVFHEGLHCTPMDYLTDYRLQMACHMLDNGNSSMTDIGQACGFGSSSYFSRVFLQKIGCPPSKYRDRMARK